MKTDSLGFCHEDNLFFKPFLQKTHVFGISISPGSAAYNRLRDILANIKEELGPNITFDGAAHMGQERSPCEKGLQGFKLYLIPL